MLITRVVRSRWRVRRASRMLHKARRLHIEGRRIIEREERLWGLSPPLPSWRVPNTP